MDTALNLAISGLALVISGITAWLTLFRRGNVRMTQPSVVYLGPDGGDKRSQKVFLRTLLFATARRGRIIQSMYVKVRRAETVQSFNIWVYGDRELVRGSGLYVGYEGVAANHHFLLPADGTDFQFLPGRYTFDVYATLVGSAGEILLWSQGLRLPEKESEALRAGMGVYYDWGPDSKRYYSHIRENPRPEVPSDLVGLLPPGFLKELTTGTPEEEGEPGGKEVGDP